MMDIRKFRSSDAKNGFLDALESLREVGLISGKKLKAINQTVTRNKVYNIFVAEWNGEIVGAATLLVEQKFIHRGGKAGHIEDVAVRNGYMGRDIGSMLVDAALEEAERQNCYKVMLYCSKETSYFYKKIGFHIIPDAVVMRIDF